MFITIYDGNILKFLTMLKILSIIYILFIKEHDLYEKMC